MKDSSGERPIFGELITLNIVSRTCIKPPRLVITIDVSISIRGVTRKVCVCESIVLFAEMPQSNVGLKEREVASGSDSSPYPYRFIFKNLFLFGTFY